MYIGFRIWPYKLRAYSVQSEVYGGLIGFGASGFMSLRAKGLVLAPGAVGTFGGLEVWVKGRFLCVQPLEAGHDTMTNVPKQFSVHKPEADCKLCHM